MIDETRAEWGRAGREPAQLAPHPWDDYGPPQPLDPPTWDGWHCEVDEHQPAHLDPVACAGAIDDELKDMGHEITRLEDRARDVEEELDGYYSDKRRLESAKAALDRRHAPLPGQLPAL